MKSSDTFINTRRNLIDGLIRVDEDLNRKLLDLTKKYPDILIDGNKASYQCSSMYVLRNLSFETKITYLRTFEEHIESLSKYVQTKLDLE